MALGASRVSVIGMVFREAFAMAAIGLVAGSACAFAVGKLTASSLYGVAAFDPLTIAAASFIICAAAFLAAWFPAQRASRVDPMVALRAEVSATVPKPAVPPAAVCLLQRFGNHCEPAPVRNSAGASRSESGGRLERRNT